MNPVCFVAHDQFRLRNYLGAGEILQFLSTRAGRINIATLVSAIEVVRPWAVRKVAQKLRVGVTVGVVLVVQYKHRDTQSHTVTARNT